MESTGTATSVLPFCFLLTYLGNEAGEALQSYEHWLAMQSHRWTQHPQTRAATHATECDMSVTDICLKDRSYWVCNFRDISGQLPLNITQKPMLTKLPNAALNAAALHSHKQLC